MTGHSPAYTVSVAIFTNHIKMLADSGYTTLLPDQLYEYLTKNIPLPHKTVMLTFDDTREEHFSVAAPVLNSFGFKGVFFIMTVAIGKPGYMTATQIRLLADSGHVIGAHTWDHPDVRKLTDQEWYIQSDRSLPVLRQITGKPVSYFAYPYGAWNETAIRRLKTAGFKAAFRLWGPKSTNDSLYTIRRLMVSGNLTAAMLYSEINKAFPK